MEGGEEGKVLITGKRGGTGKGKDGGEGEGLSSPAVSCTTA